MLSDAEERAWALLEAEAASGDPAGYLTDPWPERSPIEIRESRGWVRLPRDEAAADEADRAAALWAERSLALIDSYSLGTLTPSGLVAALRAELRLQARRAYAAGKRSMYADEVLTADELDRVDREVALDEDFLGALVASPLLSAIRGSGALDRAPATATGRRFLDAVEMTARSASRRSIDQAVEHARGVAHAEVERLTGEVERRTALESIARTDEARREAWRSTRAARRAAQAAQDRSDRVRRQAAALIAVATAVSRLLGERARAAVMAYADSLRPRIARGELTPEGAADLVIHEARRQARIAAQRGRQRAEGSLRASRSTAPHDPADPDGHRAEVEADEAITQAVGRDGRAAAVAASLLVVGGIVAPKLLSGLRDGLKRRLGGFGDRVRALGQRGGLDAVAGSGVPRDRVRVWWVLGSADHCVDCIRIADMSPYWEDGLLNDGLYPGSGHTRCGGHCRCHLEYESTVDDALPPYSAASGTTPASSGYRGTAGV